MEPDSYPHSPLFEGGNLYRGELHLVRVDVSNLRRKIEPLPGRPRHVVTEPGVGYRLRPEV